MTNWDWIINRYPNLVKDALASGFTFGITKDYIFCICTGDLFSYCDGDYPQVQQIVPPDLSNSTFNVKDQKFTDRLFNYSMKRGSFCNECIFRKNCFICGKSKQTWLNKEFHYVTATLIKSIKGPITIPAGTECKIIGVSLSKDGKRLYDLDTAYTNLFYIPEDKVQVSRERVV